MNMLDKFSLERGLSFLDRWLPNWFVFVSLLVFECILTVIIIRKVSYTEIDWIAYMQEVKGYIDGERNYTNLAGDTGPLVYPAGFVYIFAWLYHLTNHGKNILLAQYYFAGLYVINLLIVFWLYLEGGKFPFLITALLVISKRIHSIFVLRMFNDCVAIVCGYLAILLFCRRKWRWGCLVYSLGVGIKMNMLLYAPGVLLVLLVGCGVMETIVCLSICAGLQLALGWPFLTTYPIPYLTRSFDLGRVFLYKWTVNFKFLPENIFLSKTLSIVLLICTLSVWVLFAYKWIHENQRSNRVWNRIWGNKQQRTKPLTSHFILTTIFLSNFIGVVFARTLHYQFYVWYFHTLPYLLWHAKRIPIRLKLLLLVNIEVGFNVYPATPLSSIMLQLSHIIILAGLYVSNAPMMEHDEDPNAKKQD